MEPIFVYGAGGHGKVVVDAVEAASRGFRVGIVVDGDARMHGALLRGHAVAGPDRIRNERGVIAIGSNDARLSIAEAFRGRLVTIVHPTAWISAGAELGEGTVVLAGSFVGSDARLGDNVIINTGATVDHDCVVGDGVHIAPGCHLCGSVRIERGAFLGVGTVVSPGVRIGRRAFVQAGSRVSRDVRDEETVRMPQAAPTAG